MLLHFVVARIFFEFRGVVSFREREIANFLSVMSKTSSATRRVITTRTSWYLRTSTTYDDDDHIGL
jgi:hypothetical protein